MTADKHESKESEVSLSLPMEDWEWFLAHLATQYYECASETPVDKQREAWLVGLLVGRLHCHKAAQAAGVLDEMKILDSPEPIELENDK